MELAGWLRAEVWRAPDWCVAVRALADRFAADPTAATAGQASDLGHALELMEPDRKRALAVYLVAWRTGARSDALDRARVLAREVRAHDLIAELALIDFERTNDAAHLVTAGLAWIDAGTPEQAVPPLSRAALQRPSDQELKTILAAAKGELRDPRAEISRCAARASRASRDEQARIYLHAARLAHIAKIDDLTQRFLQMAFHQRRDQEIAGLIEDRLLARGKADELLEFYRTRLETVTNDLDWIETVRSTATKLLLGGIQPGFALRLLRRGLEHAYGAKLVDVPGHLASWELLLRHARRVNATREIMPLVVEALRLPLRDDARLYLSLVGVEISSRDARDVEAARLYATAVTEIVPDHPAVRELMPKQADPATTGAVVIAVATAEPEAAPAASHAALAEPAPKVAAVPAPTGHAEPALADVARSSLPAAVPVRRPVLSVIPAAALSALRGHSQPMGVVGRGGDPSRAPRAVVPIDVTLTPSRGGTIQAVARDLSTTGVFVTTDHELDLGEIVMLELRLPGAHVLDVSRHRVSVQVMRCAETGYGMSLIDPSSDLVKAISGLPGR